MAETMTMGEVPISEEQYFEAAVAAQGLWSQKMEEIGGLQHQLLAAQSKAHEYFEKYLWTSIKRMIPAMALPEGLALVPVTEVTTFHHNLLFKMNGDWAELFLAGILTGKPDWGLRGERTANYVVVDGFMLHTFFEFDKVNACFKLTVPYGLTERRRHPMVRLHKGKWEVACAIALVTCYFCRFTNRQQALDCAVALYHGKDVTQFGGKHFTYMPDTDPIPIFLRGEDVVDSDT